MQGKTLNILSAFKLTGTMKLSTRIADFRRDGMVFKAERKQFKTRFGTHGCYIDYTLDAKKTPKKVLKMIADS
jgi:hypothetical protein